jgi:hypothetical protein
VEPTQLEQQIGELETAIDRLRSLYDQYFMGIEKLEPGVPRKDVDRKIYALRKEQIRNTALRFRFQMILQRYSTFQSHWQRICREIENGTYKRHVLRAERRKASAPPPPVALPEPGAPSPRDLASELAELDKEFAPATLKEGPPPRAAPPPAAPRAPPPLPAPRAPPSSAAASKVPQPPAAPPLRRDDGLPEYRVRQLYVEYVEAKRRQKESTAALTYESLAESLRASSARLREKHGKAVDFEVGIKDGKAVLRPRIK